MKHPARLLALLPVLAFPVGTLAEPLEDRVATLLEGLGSPLPAERQDAEAALAAEAASGNAQQVLAALPTPQPTMPTTVRDALQRVRLRIVRDVAQASVAPSRVTLDVHRAPLAEVLASFEKQTGNQLIDQRGAFGGTEDAREVTLSLDNEPFWPAVYALLDAARLEIYPYGKQGTLTLIDRSGEAPTKATRTSAGPLAFRAHSVVATRGLSNADESSLELNLRVMWEPRLRPIAFSQPMQNVVIRTASGTPIPPRTPQQSVNLEAGSGEQTLDLNLAFAPPPRSVERLESVSGKLIAIVPGATHTFRVEKLGEAERVTQRLGDASVTFERFVKRNAIWELHMRLRMANAGDALASHRGWVFENASYLLTPDGRRIEHAGFETTRQSDDEIGLAYLFDLAVGELDENGFPVPAAEPAEPVDPKTLTWVYETPSAVYTVPTPWELGPIDLP